MLFTLGNKENCCFIVGHEGKEKAIGITAIDADTEEKLATFTWPDENANHEIGVATILNEFVEEDEIEGCKTAVEVLKKLGIVEKVLKKYDVDCVDVALCSINLDKLAQYSKRWGYSEYEVKK